MGHDSIPHWVPRNVARDLDVAELVRETAELRRQCRALERILGVYVAAYRAGATGHPRGLCIIYEAAPMLPSHLARIRAAEAQHPGVVFVAYRRPLRRRNRGPQRVEVSSNKPLQPTRAASLLGQRETARFDPRG